MNNYSGIGQADTTPRLATPAPPQRQTAEPVTAENKHHAEIPY